MVSLFGIGCSTLLHPLGAKSKNQQLLVRHEQKNAHGAANDCCLLRHVFGGSKFSSVCVETLLYIASAYGCKVNKLVAPNRTEPLTTGRMKCQVFMTKLSTLVYGFPVWDRLQYIASSFRCEVKKSAALSSTRTEECTRRRE
jgi:hypothetical protein